MEQKDLELMVDNLSAILGYSPEIIKGKDRHSAISKARQMAQAFLCSKKSLLQLTYTEIGKAFNRDHATVMHSERSIKAWCETNKLFLAEYENFTSKANGLIADYINGVAQSVTESLINNLLDKMPKELAVSVINKLQKEHC